MAAQVHHLPALGGVHDFRVERGDQVLRKDGIILQDEGIVQVRLGKGLDEEQVRNVLAGGSALRVDKRFCVSRAEGARK